MNRWQKCFLVIGALVVAYVVLAGVRGSRYYEASGYQEQMNQVKEDFDSLFPLPYSSQNEEVSDDNIGAVLTDRDDIVFSMRESLQKEGHWAIVIPCEWRKQGSDGIETPDPEVLIFK